MISSGKVLKTLPEMPISQKTDRPWTTETSNRSWVTCDSETNAIYRSRESSDYGEGSLMCVLRRIANTLEDVHERLHPIFDGTRFIAGLDSQLMNEPVSYGAPKKLVYQVGTKKSARKSPSGKLPTLSEASKQEYS